MAPSDIDKNSVLAAIAEYDKLGQSDFMTRYSFGKASRFRLVYRSKFYDSKAIAGVAHGFATNDFWTAERPFGGTGPGGAVTILEDLGFLVDRGELLFELTQLNVDETHGRKAPYQYVVFLWALARAERHEVRLVLFNDVRDELAALLVPFALSKTAPDPAMPWAALANSGLWQLDPSRTSLRMTDSEVKRLNVAGGLSENVYWKAAEDGAFVAAAVDVIAGIVGGESAFAPLLQRLNLPLPLQLETPSPSSLEVINVIEAVESVSNPRRTSGGPRFSAAENKAIEEHAVKLTRDHFENDLGFTTEDVGATRSYDIHAIKGDKVVKVEVKGTTTDGRAVVLTRNEVNLHRAEHPNNALAVVRKITLHRNGDEPSATGGELSLVMPWELDEGSLSAIAYDYTTGL